MTFPAPPGRDRQRLTPKGERHGSHHQAQLTRAQAAPRPRLVDARLADAHRTSPPRGFHTASSSSVSPPCFRRQVHHALARASPTPCRHLHAYIRDSTTARSRSPCSPRLCPCSRCHALLLTDVFTPARAHPPHRGMCSRFLRLQLAHACALTHHQRPHLHTLLQRHDRQLAHAFTLAHPRSSPQQIEHRRIDHMQARSRSASVNQRLQTFTFRLLSFNENASLHRTPEVMPLARIIVFPSTQVLP